MQARLGMIPVEAGAAIVTTTATMKWDTARLRRATERDGVPISELGGAVGTLTAMLGDAIAAVGGAGAIWHKLRCPARCDHLLGCDRYANRRGVERNQ